MSGHHSRKPLPSRVGNEAMHSRGIERPRGSTWRTGEGGSRWSLKAQVQRDGSQSLGPRAQAEKVLAAKRCLSANLRPLRVDDSPFLDSETLNVFEQRLARSRTLVEYGSGASTVVAARIADRIVSVESNRRFAQLVENTARGSGAEVQVAWGNIGLTEGWGIPLLQRNTSRRLRRWREYVARPWEVVAQSGIGPESFPFVLVDGRFRVATAAFSLLQLVDVPDAAVLVDDYVLRPNYWALESASTVVERPGRSVLLSPRPGASELLKQLVQSFSNDWR